MKNRFHIVGLRYYSWKEQMEKIFCSEALQNDTWVGQKLFLQRDLQCVEDAHAVMAWTLTAPVGHVCKLDLPVVSKVLEQGTCNLIVVRIVALDISRRSLVVEPVEELPQTSSSKQEEVRWSWEGPVMPLPAVWAQADHFGRMMMLLAKGEITWNEEAKEVVKLYMEYTITDLSADAYATRSMLAYTLMLSDDQRLADVGHALMVMMDHMGSKELMSTFVNRMDSSMLNTREARLLAARYAEIDMQQVLSALRSFPMEIGRDWLSGDTERFVNRLYYAQLPRSMILQLFSLIILYTSACARMQSSVPQPAIGLMMNAPCNLSTNTLKNYGTVLGIDQAVFPNR